MEKEHQQKAEKIFSVSDYIKIVNQGLKNFRAKIIGEVSEVNFGPTGHVYFYLKDKKDGSIIKCIIWKSRYDIYGIELKEGIKIVAFGSPNIHSKYGFAFIAETIEYSGEGVLKKEYEKLKQKLIKEGVFEEARKRSIPVYPQKIGVITSLKGGVVIADFSNNLGRFGFKVKMIDSRVEGQAAVADLLLSIKTFRKQNIEILVIMRGGGSLESMMAFNNELLVREIANFPVPVIAAIGHHKDVPLAALTADRSVSTPSIAAIVLSESWEQATSLLEGHKRDIISSYVGVLEDTNTLIKQSIEKIYEMYGDTLENATSLVKQLIDKICATKDLIFDKYKEVETALKISFQVFKNALQNGKINSKNSWKKSIFGFKSLLLIINQHLEHSDKIIEFNNPERQLKLGYSIARCNGRVVRSIQNTKIGEDLDIRVKDGVIISKVKNIHPVK